MSEQHPRRLLRAGVCLHRIPACALISRDAGNTSMIPAVCRLSAAHHGLSAMPTAHALLAFLLRAGLRASADTGRPHM